MTFVKECIEDSLPIWEACLDTSFLRQLADGTLPEELFKGYIIDDSLYLMAYTKVFAMGILKAESMEEIRAYYSLLSFVSEAEDATRAYYLERYGLRDEDVQKLPLRPENQAYVDTMTEAVANAPGPAECFMACLPCMLSYEWIFAELVKRFPKAKDTVYGRFVNDYTGNFYDKLKGGWYDFAEKSCRNLTPARQKNCRAIFRKCSEHELKFWEMSARARACFS